MSDWRPDRAELLLNDGATGVQLLLETIPLEDKNDVRLWRAWASREKKRFGFDVPLVGPRTQPSGHYHHLN